MLPLFVSDVPLSCINAAAYEYRVPAKLIIAVLNVERGKKELASHNTNGTYDLGPMQFNTSLWPMLYRYDIKPQQVLYDPCTNVKVGSWILSSEIAESNNLFDGIRDYHSYTKGNMLYGIKVMMQYNMIAQFLK